MLPSYHQGMQAFLTPRNDWHVQDVRNQAHRLSFDVVSSAEYEVEILKHMYTLQYALMPHPAHMERQACLTWDMRSELIGYLMEVHQEHGLQPETLHLATNILDRFASRCVIARNKYQLVGLTALWIASKYEEEKSSIPKLLFLCHMCRHCYSRPEFKRMEMVMLKALQFRIGFPTPEAFFKLLCPEQELLVPDKRPMARYIMDLCMFAPEFLRFPSSVLAHTAHYLSSCILGGRSQVKVSSDTVECFSLMNQYLAFPPPSLRLKYWQGKYSRMLALMNQWVALRIENSIPRHLYYYQHLPPTPTESYSGEYQESNFYKHYT